MQSLVVVVIFDKSTIKKVIRYLIIPVLLPLTTSSNTHTYAHTFHVPYERFASERLWAPLVLHAEQQNHTWSSNAYSNNFTKTEGLCLFLLFRLFMFASAFVTNSLSVLIDELCFNFLVLCVHKTTNYFMSQVTLQTHAPV